MPKKRKILILSVPFSGHLNVLKNLIEDHKDLFEFKLIITGWTNIRADLIDLNIEKEIIETSELKETDPALWTFPRVSEQLERCIKITEEFNPDIILYDFFSIEGYFLGKLLGIPYWCSIPALISPFNNRSYLTQKISAAKNQKSIKEISKKFGIEIKQQEIEMISDGFHFPGQINILWSYSSVVPIDFKKNRLDVPYVFVGSAKENRRSQKVKNPRPRIYFSFGTVVMNNLWNQQEETRQRLIDFIVYLSRTWKNRPWDITFVSQDKKIMDSFPDNWHVIKFADQMKELGEADVFVTHAGSNGFHEAIVQKTPMIAIPFFGDQPLVAQTIERLGLGISLGKDSEIDTHKSMGFLDKNLAESLDQAISKILNDEKFAKTFDKLDLSRLDITSLLEGKIHFDEGDLLFGTNIARKKYVEETDSQQEFKILEFKAFSELVSKENALPRIVDIYHDVVLSNDYFEKDINSNLKPYTEILKKYKEHLGGASDFGTMCIKGLDFFSDLFKIHFILTEYDPQINYITTKEIEHVIINKDRFKKSVIFYDQVASAWIPITYEEVVARFLKAK